MQSAPVRSPAPSRTQPRTSPVRIARGRVELIPLPEDRVRPVRRRASAHRAAARRGRLFMTLGFMAAVLAGSITYFWPAVAVAFSGTGHHLAAIGDGGNGSGGAGAGGASAPFTVLLLGSDNDSKFSTDHALTQSMILVRVDPGAGKVTMLSIPRDLYVPLSTGGTDKIDKAYMYGQANAAVQTVENDFHLHVDHYVWIGLQGLVNLIDSVGGVDIDATHPVLDDFYPADQTSQNPYDYDRIAIMGGPQHLDGLQAMEYVRSRHDDALSDIGRSQRQQQVLVALRSKLQGLNVSDVPRLATAMAGQFSTDIDLTNVSYLTAMLSLSHKVDPTKIGHQVLLQQYWKAEMVGGQSVLVPDWSQILPMVHQTFPATS